MDYQRGVLVHTHDFAGVWFCRHHAEADRGMGFCLLANVALAAMHAKASFGLKRIAIVDYDVHHGEHTQRYIYTHRYIYTQGE